MKNPTNQFIKYGILLTIAMLPVFSNAQDDCEKKLDSWNKSSFPEGKVQDYENCVKDLEASTSDIEKQIKNLKNELESKRKQLSILKKSYDQLIKYWDSEDNGEKADEYKARKTKIDKIKTE